MTEVQMIPFVGPTYELLGVSMAQRRAINCFLQSGEGEAKYDELLIGTPGTKLIEDLAVKVGSPDLGCRGLWMCSAGPFNGGQLYSVFGSKLCKTHQDPLTNALITTVLYDIGSGVTRVSMTDNGGFMVLVDGAHMFTVDIFLDVIKDITSTLPFTQPKQVVYLGSRIIAITADPEPTTRKDLGQVLKRQLIWWSELGIGGEDTWSALGFASAESNPDAIDAIQIRQGDVWAWGASSYQVFEITDNPDAPFAYAQGSASSVGINAPYSAAALGETVFWVGSNAAGRNVVLSASGYNASRISNHGIENILLKYGRLAELSYGFAYQEAGHLFYCLTIPPGEYEYEGNLIRTDGHTICYDATTQQWHERASRQPKTGVLQAWQPLYAAYGFGRIIVGNLLWPALMELRQDTYTDYDPTTIDLKKPIYREYQGGVMFNELRNFIIDEFQWDIITGHGPLNGLSKAPVANLQISHDGGNTWSSVRSTSLASTGHYAGRVRWLRLGMARAVVLRIYITEDMLFTAGGGRTRARLSGNP